LKKNPLVRLTDCGLFCEKGDFYIDPWKGVKRALITHAHSDHARIGSDYYLCTRESFFLLRLRLGDFPAIDTVSYGEQLNLNSVKVKFLPAGHVLGSAQIRIEYEGEVWVISGDYKTEEDFTCEKFEPVKCNVFITESTFALPIYKWCKQDEIFVEINQWWKRNAENKITSMLFGYSLGKAQRILSGLDVSIGPILCHGAVENINNCYRQTGIKLPATQYLAEVTDKDVYNTAMIIAPPSADSGIYLKKFKNYSAGFASGWMQIRGNRRRRAVDRGFVLSDHADWNGLINTVKETGAEKIYVTHGYSPSFVKYLCEQGYDASVIQTKFEGESEED
jgi:putative mRNA 3-end processing factor